MKTKILSVIAAVALAMTSFVSLAVTANAATNEEDFYVDNGEIQDYTGNGGDVEIPATKGGEAITSIGEEAFEGREITSVTIPNSVESIGRRAFAHCFSLTSVTISDGVTSIGEEAFAFCESLTSIAIPVSVESIGDHAFDMCFNLTINYAGSQDQWEDITGAEYIDSDITVKYNAQSQTIDYNCGENLTWSLDDSGTLTISGTGAMYNYNYDNYAPWYSKRSSIKNVVIGSGATSIGHYAFSKCGNLTGVTIPSSVTSIGEYAFDGCTSLAGIDIPSSVTYIGGCAFDGCTSLTSVPIPDGITRIESGLVDGCTSLESIVIPSSVTYIDVGAFDGCTSLTIYYNGTAAQWQAVGKGYYWNRKNRPVYVKGAIISNIGAKYYSLLDVGAIAFLTTIPTSDWNKGDVLWTVKSGNHTGKAKIVYNYFADEGDTDVALIVTDLTDAEAIATASYGTGEYVLYTGQ